MKKKGTFIFWILHATQLSMFLVAVGCVITHALSAGNYDSYCEIYDMDCDHKEANQVCNKVLIALGSAALGLNFLFILHNLVFSRCHSKSEPKK